MPAAPAQALWPPVLLPTPWPVAAQDLELLGSPHRIESGWFDDDPQLRDYYLARLSPMGLVWVFCDRLRRGPHAAKGAPPRWFVHGVFG